MLRALRLVLVCTGIAAAVACTTETHAGIVLVGTPFRDFTWGSGRTYSTGTSLRTDSSYTRSENGITQESTAITDSGFTMTTTGSSPATGEQWTQYVFVGFYFTEDTTLTLSGTLYSPPPMIADPFGYQYVNLTQGGTTLFDLTGGGSFQVPGPQTYSYTTTLLANTTYSLEANTSWADAIDGGTQTFMTFSTVAVPEPSTYVMALAGLACGGYSVFRRRHAR